MHKYEWFLELGHFDKHFVNTIERGHAGKYFEIYSPRYT